MTFFRVTRKALEDLKIIGSYTAKEWGLSQRNHYLKQLDDCFSLLADDPGLGTYCDDIATGYYKFPQGSHVVFYKLDPDGVVEIIRVLHKAMDVGKQFDEVRETSALVYE